MYLAERASLTPHLSPRPASVSPHQRRRIGSTVVLLGVTSFITDISAEMITTVLPLYVVFQLGMTPLAFGVLEGLFQGATALLRLASGVVTDRWRSPKQVATAGYALSAISKLGLALLPGGLGVLAGLALLDRLGKGIRTAPRDALIASDAPHGRLASAFGLHRALDTAGSMLGPFVSLAILALAPRAYGVVFAVSSCIALIGVGVIGLLVRNPPAAVTPAPRALRSAFAAMLRDRRLRALLGVTTLLGLATASDAFIFLGLQRRVGFNPGVLPLLYVGSAGVFMLLAIPVGRIADRVGRTRVLFAGYGLLLAAYVALLAPISGIAGVALCVALLGAYYAATDGILMAMVAVIVPAEVRASGMALVTTVISLTKLVSAVLFGAAWSLWGLGAAVVVFAAALVLAIVLSIILVARASRAEGVVADVQP